MSDGTKIEWTDATWNPLRARRKDTGKTGWHCERVSAGCKNCYAATFNGRMLPNGGTGLDFTLQSRDRVEMFLDQKMLELPLHWKKPRKVFVCSMTDLFAHFVPFEFIDKVFAVMALTPQHTYQILTKRPERMAEYLRLQMINDRCWAWKSFGNLVKGDARVNYAAPLPNVWIGTSVEDQPSVDNRVPYLLQCPAAVRFLSAEPLLGPLEFSDVSKRSDGVLQLGKKSLDGIGWVIVGGESGAGARPMHPDWARSIRDQCVVADVPFFMKQWGAYGAGSVNMTTGEPVFRQFENKQQWINKASTWVNGGICVDTTGKILKNGADFDSAKYPVAIMHKLGKHDAGRLLDGKVWNEFPNLERGPSCV